MSEYKRIILPGMRSVPLGGHGDFVYVEWMIRMIDYHKR